MICFVYDSTNEGIVWIGRKLAVANKIKEGLLDTEMSFLSEGHPSYNALSSIDIRSSHYQWSVKTVAPVAMPDSAVNSFYLEKKRLAGLRSRIFPALYNISHWANRKTFVSPVAGIEADLQVALDECDLDAGVYSFSVNEYALTTGIPVAEAYKELKFRVDGMRTQRIRIYSQFEYFSKKINTTTTGAEMNEIYNEMMKKFVKDTLL